LEKIRIQFTLFSAFYSPLISAMSGGFLEAEGLEPQWSVSPPGVSAIAALQDGSAHVVQSALSQAFAVLDKGETPPAVHFAQVNEMDGFFLTGREADRCRGDRQGLPRGARAVCPAAGPVPAAAPGRRRRAHRRAGRQADRALRVLQPGGDP
jgi:ABC-type nitrate/sulfonate/bicarbonate transport system substrate-binding protein